MDAQVAPITTQCRKDNIMKQKCYITRDRGTYETIIWPIDADLRLDEQGTWWDEKCRYRGEPITAADNLLGGYIKMGGKVEITVECDPTGQLIVDGTPIAER
jgi:hypothetical protein